MINFLQDMYWVGHSVTNHVDAMLFKNRQETRDGDDEFNEKYALENFGVGAFDQVLLVPKKHKYKTTPEDNI